MLKRLFRITLPSALLFLAGLAVSIAWSKPPDLPIDVKETCTPQRPDAVRQESATIFTSTGLDERGAGEPNGAANSDAPCQPKILDVEAYKAQAAQSFYEIAQQCEDKGDLAMARNCYEEATRMGPESPYGKLASRKLTAITVASVENRAARGGVETEEEPPLIKQETTQEDTLDPRRVMQSHIMLRMGNRFQRHGDLDNAYRCFQDAHVVCPACSDAQSALDRMRQIEGTKSGELKNREGGIEEQEPPSDRRPPLTPDELDKRDQAEVLFKLGERSRRAGNLETAYGLYQETHLVFPECFYGMRAIELMSEIETHR